MDVFVEACSLLKLLSSHIFRRYTEVTIIKVTQCSLKMVIDIRAAESLIIFLLSYQRSGV
jgi:hypothetical protein